MKYLVGIEMCRYEFGRQLVLRLSYNWRIAAAKFPTDRLQIALASSVEVATKVLREAPQLKCEQGKGLTGISLSDRKSLDLLTDQNCYMGHNLTRAEEVAALSLIIVEYLSNLELF